MRKIVWGQLLLAFATTCSFIGIGISLGLKSTSGAIVSLLLAIIFIGLGFKSKQKLVDKQRTNLS